MLYHDHDGPSGVCRLAAATTSIVASTAGAGVGAGAANGSLPALQRENESWFVAGGEYCTKMGEEGRGREREGEREREKPPSWASKKLF